MKRILLTLMMTGLTMMAFAQLPSLTELYWSSGSLTLENEKTLEGFTSYYPNLDVIFFKHKNTHQIKIYHISTVAALQFFDNGMREDRQFIKLPKPYKQGEDMFEVISMGEFYMLRTPHAANYQYDYRSKQIIDQQDHYTRYRYWIATDHAQEGLSIIPRSQANKIAAFIRTEDLDCYDPQDQQRISEFSRKKIGNRYFALSTE